MLSAHWYFYALFTHTPPRKVGNSIVSRKTSWPKEIGSSRRSKEQRSHRQQGSRLAKRLQPKGVLATTGTLPAAAVRTLTQSASNQNLPAVQPIGCVASVVHGGTKGGARHQPTGAQANAAGGRRCVSQTTGRILGVLTGRQYQLVLFFHGDGTTTMPGLRTTHAQRRG